MDTEKQLKVKEAGSFDFEKRFPVRSEGRKRLGVVSKNTIKKNNFVQLFCK